MLMTRNPLKMVLNYCHWNICHYIFITFISFILIFVLLQEEFLDIIKLTCLGCSSAGNQDPYCNGLYILLSHYLCLHFSLTAEFDKVNCTNK